MARNRPITLVLVKRLIARESWSKREREREREKPAVRKTLWTCRHDPCLRFDHFISSAIIQFIEISGQRWKTTLSLYPQSALTTWPRPASFLPISRKQLDPSKVGTVFYFCLWHGLNGTARHGLWHTHFSWRSWCTRNTSHYESDCVEKYSIVGRSPKCCLVHAKQLFWIDFKTSIYVVYFSLRWRSDSTFKVIWRSTIQHPASPTDQ